MTFPSWEPGAETRSDNEHPDGEGHAAQVDPPHPPGDHEEDADRHGELPAAGDEPGRTSCGEPRTEDREQRETHRQRQDLHTGLQGVATQHRLQIDRHHEEEGGDREVLREEPAQSAAQRGYPQQFDAEKWLPAGTGKCALSIDEQPEDDDAEQQQVGDRGHAQRGDLRAVDLRRMLRFQPPPPRLRLQHTVDDERQAAGGREDAHRIDPHVAIAFDVVDQSRREQDDHHDDGFGDEDITP